MARTSRAEWEKRVERWQDSGLSAKEFATEIGVTAQSLMLWKWKLRHAEVDLAKPARKQDEGPKFLQLVAAGDAPMTQGPLELLLPSGITLRLHPGFHEPTLLRLVDLLGGR